MCKCEPEGIHCIERGTTEMQGEQGEHDRSGSEGVKCCPVALVPWNSPAGRACGELFCTKT